MTPRIVTLDQGTSSTKALIVDVAGHVHARASVPLTSLYPQDGWAEQSAEAIWQSVQQAIAIVVAEAGAEGIVGLALANQRETIVLWDADTARPIANAILWQCGRGAALCDTLIAEGHNEAVEAATGLGISSMFPASKLAHAYAALPEARALHTAGRLRAGTVDAWLLFNLTGGRRFATDHSNASRTQLFDTAALRFSPALGALFGVPIDILPEPLPSDARFGETAEGATALPAGLPIHAMLGDSHAALFGHGVRSPGPVKATYGTGSSLMTLTEGRVLSSHGLSGTIAWTTGQTTHYALEGNIIVSAQAAGFAASLLGLADVAALDRLAQSVPDSGGVSFVPALSGLGAPHWRTDARGLIDGLSLSTQPAHIARASFEAIALQIADVFAAMEQDRDTRLSGLLADGGASANPFLMQVQADVLDRPVERGDLPELGALGAAAMAFNALGIAAPALDSPGHPDRFIPRMDASRRTALRAGWHAALRRVLG
jgi:glycerol kinase